MSRLGYLLARSAFEHLREKMDPSNSNGGIFLGLNGIVTALVLPWILIWIFG